MQKLKSNPLALKSGDVVEHTKHKVQRRELKPLVWEQIRKDFFLAQTPFGNYVVWENRYGWGYYQFINQCLEQRLKCSSLAHGKELCQKDFEERIRKCFEGDAK